MSDATKVRQLLADMLEHALYVQGFVEGVSNEKFQSDRLIQFAVVRALEVIGEAAKGIPTEARNSAPNLPWAQMTGMRDKLVHRYFGVDASIVWETAVNDMPGLIQGLTEMLDALDRHDT